MVFCFQNCSDLLQEKKCSIDREKLLKFEDEGQEFEKKLRSLERLAQTVKGQNNSALGHLPRCWHSEISSLTKKKKKVGTDMIRKLRPEFKLPAKIEMTFSKILFITGWFNWFQ